MSEKPKSKWNWKDSELISLCQEYGLDVITNEDNKGLNRKAVVDALNVFEADADEKVYKTAKKIETEQKEDPSRKLVKVVFHSTGELDLPYVPVGINGSFFYFPKEKEIKVPVFILNVLKDAVEDRMYPETVEGGKIQWRKRRVQRFPYSVVEF
jgi:hypothetical protein